MTYFLQRVTASGYQKGPARSPGDTNTHLRFGTGDRMVGRARPWLRNHQLLE